MTVTSLTSLAAGIQRELNTRNSRVANSIHALVSGSRLTRASADVTALSVAVSLQNQVSSLRSAALNVSQASSVLQVADAGAEQITGSLERLGELATLAQSGALNDADRNALNDEFQSVYHDISLLAKSTKFNGQNLLDGSFDAAAGLGGNDDVQLTLPDLQSEGLFGDAKPNLNTSEDAARALDAVRSAQVKVTEARADIGSYQYALNFASGAIESAIQNQDASRSILSDADFTSLSTERAQVQVGQSAATSLLAQANRLPANILQLLGS